MAERKKRNIIIGSLCAVVLLMGVGYAAFSTVLNINGTSNITSNWNVKITNITSKNIVGTASNNGEPTFEDLSATFKTNLVSPGDSIEYEITVGNLGNINAKLDKYTLTDTNNPAIKFTQTGLSNGEVLNAGTNKTFIVKVEYLSTVTGQPSKVDSNLSITLDYSQANNGYVPGDQTAAEMLTSNLVTSGDGLYIDTYENGRYVYKGANPNNYITFNGEPWRIISVEADGNLKVKKSASIGNIPWDTSNSNNWARPATLNTYLNNDYYSALSSDAKGQIQSHAFGIGAVTYNNTDLMGQIASENGTIWTGNIALMSVSDYLRANTNTVKCGNLYLNNINYETCKTTNYLAPASGYSWTISPYADSSDVVLHVRSGGTVSYAIARNTTIQVYPVLYLKSDITLSGEGTSSSPYIIN